MAREPINVTLIQGNHENKEPTTFGVRLLVCTDQELASTSADTLASGVYAVSRVAHIKQIIERCTGLPPEKQFVACNGVSLSDDAKTLTTLPRGGLTEGSKIYVIPRKEEAKEGDVSEGQDSVLLRLEDIAKEKVKPLSTKITDLLMDVERGTSNEEHGTTPNALDKMRLQLTEDCMKMLEFLDSINVRCASVNSADEESVERRRAARKMLVGELQANLDKLDVCATQLAEALKEQASQ